MGRMALRHVFARARRWVILAVQTFGIGTGLLLSGVKNRMTDMQNLAVIMARSLITMFGHTAKLIHMTRVSRAMASVKGQLAMHGATGKGPVAAGTHLGDLMR